MAYTHRVRVRYGECDAQGVVFNAHWLAYFDDALTHYVGHLGYDPKDTFLGESPTFDVMLVKSVIEWSAAVGFDDVIEIDVAPTRLGRSSFDLRYVARLDGTDAVTATITYVSIRPGENTPVTIPDDVRARLEADHV